jgi:hypothetical protein
MARGKKFRKKVLTPFVQPTGNSETPDTTAVTVIEKDGSGNVLRATGTTVPTNTEAGFSKGSIFIKTDAGAGVEGIYRNVGTTASCTFEALDTISASEIALTDGDMLLGDGTNKAQARTMSQDATIDNTGKVTVSQATGNFTVQGGQGQVSKTDDGAAGAVQKLRHNSASPAPNDIVGTYEFEGNDDAANPTVYGSITGQIDSETDGAEIGSIHVEVQNGTGSQDTAASFEHDGANGRILTGVILNDANLGAPSGGVVAEEYGDGMSHITVLTLTNEALEAPTAAAAEAHGQLLYTFPAGVHVHEITNMNISLQGGGTVDTDTPDVGIGSVKAAGAQALLSGVGATTEDYITGQTWTATCNGTPTAVGPLGAVAGVLTGISLNAGGDAKTVYLNYADTWAGADTLSASGTVIIKWSSMS